jgi:hypothetical protein
LLELDSGNLQDVSKQHRDYYVKRLAMLEEKAGISASANAKSVSTASSASPIERDDQFVLRQELERARLQSPGE